MEKDLCKRIEEAADKAMPESIRVNPAYTPSYHCGFEKGTKWGYKEAIAQTKEWLDSNSENYLGLINEEKLTASTFRTAQLIADFESDMLNFLEEKKDKQFKEYFEEKKKQLYNRYDFIGNNAVVCRVLLDEIINELFNKEN